MIFESTRAAGQARIADFLPRAGPAYSETRNFGDGVPDDGARQNVSQLSPWLYAGLIGEAEIIGAVLSQHRPQAAESFISEVFWRVYFKGYLEHRPTIWRASCEQRGAALAEIGRNSGLRTAHSAAVVGRTGIAALDHWARELVETGYLHNHARMWFASIWIFTLRLDWTLGADFFLRHLIDGDAASNTLSWRWVAGLHTKGKTYLARADNIARYTGNIPGGPLAAQALADEAPPLVEQHEHGRSALTLPSAASVSALKQPFALLLHDEAASHVPLILPAAPTLVIGAARPDARSPLETGNRARNFARSAVENGVCEAGKAFSCAIRSWEAEETLAQILASAGLASIALPYLPTGWTPDALLPDLEPLMASGNAGMLLDDLSRGTWHHAKAGFFGVKKEISAILGEIGLVAG